MQSWPVVVQGPQVVARFGNTSTSLLWDFTWVSRSFEMQVHYFFHTCFFLKLKMKCIDLKKKHSTTNSQLSKFKCKF